MASVHQYFETDFSHLTKVQIRIDDGATSNFEAFLYCDFASNSSFLSLFVPGTDTSLDTFVAILRRIEYGKTKVALGEKILLPSARNFPGALSVHNANPFQMSARFFGEDDWISFSEIQSSRRVFVYSDTQLGPTELAGLKLQARVLGHELQFRSKIHADERSRGESPLAFISHDSRDKDEVARKIAIGLGRMMCPVWYDEFSLKVGDNLRERIEAGIKNCKKCILVLSENFFSNKGWTKKEFDLIFTREILEQNNVVLPVWFGVSKAQVYEYSPSLLLTKGVDWKAGEDEVCRQLNLAITAAD